MTTYLGIDASLEGTGLCLLDNTGHVLRAETVSTGLRGVARLAEIKKRADLFIPHDVEFAAMEGYAYHGVGLVFELGEVGGVLRLLVHERRVTYVDVPPSNLKKFATGFTSADKDDMISAAQDAGARPEDDNQADAYFLARIAIACVHRDAVPLKRSQMEVVHRLLHPIAKKSKRRARRFKNAV